MQTYKEKVMALVRAIEDNWDEDYDVGLGLWKLIQGIKEIPEDTELYEAQKEYIEFLEHYANSVSGYLSVHGIMSSKEDVEKGVALRKKISELSPPLPPNHK